MESLVSYLRFLLTVFKHGSLLLIYQIFSVEEDADNDQKDEKSEANKRRESFAMRGKSNCNIESINDENVNGSLRKESLDEKVGRVPSMGSQR